jgi:hypothetical protein
MEVDPILVYLVALCVVVYVVDRWHTTRRIAAIVCSDCGQEIGRPSARGRRKLRFANHHGWDYTCGQCGAAHLELPPPLRRSFRE